jgi:hypothetical protein
MRVRLFASVRKRESMTKPGLNIMYYYLFKKFLVSDWLTANCEIVISTQWLTKYEFFTFILAK